MISEKIYFITVGITLLLTILITKRLIPVLLSKKIGQKILDIGPRWHKSKEGTPTMGGLGFVLAICIAFIVILTAFYSQIEKKETHAIINIFLFGMVNGIIGLIDDIAKFRKKKNEGLTPKGKLILQSISAIVFLLLMKATIGISTTIKIPFIGIELEMGFFYYIVSFLLLCGITNAVNLTDGVDGLASTCILSVGAFLSFIGFVKVESIAVTFFGAALVGASLGFLLFNLHPAKIFMGDTGSLFFGAIVVGVSFAINNPLIVLVYGFVFVLEALSVMLQVAWFKISKGKRLFKMAPLHHHFEKCGWSEMKVVSVLGIVSSLFCIIAFWGI